MTLPVIDLRSPLEPIATNLEPRLSKLSDVRAVIFDVYGTLLISGCGEVGSATDQPTESISRSDPMAEALIAIGVTASSEPSEGGPFEGGPRREDLIAMIRDHNQRAQSEDRPSPEVEILSVWRDLMIAFGHADVAEDPKRLQMAAATFEAIANPTWPMPGAADLIQSLADSGRSLGIVSNAQVFTIDLVESLTGQRLHEGPFDLDLCVFSNRYRQSKPGPRLFAVLRSMLDRSGVRADQAVYVGNDMLNDVWAAKQAGLRTAWFVGDQRSARPRENDDRCRSLSPDVIVTQLSQLIACFS